jgi:Flp pilus assembly protein TadD
LKHAAAGVVLEPLVWYFLGEAYCLARDFTRAAAASTEALELHPNCWYLRLMAGKALAMLGDYNGALRHLRLAKLLNPEDAGLVAVIAWVYAMAGKGDHAAQLLGRVTTGIVGHQPSFMVLAMVHAALGNKSSALDSIEQACAGHDWWVAGLKRDPTLDSLRTDQRFRGLVSHIGV